MPKIKKAELKMKQKEAKKQLVDITKELKQAQSDKSENKTQAPFDFSADAPAGRAGSGPFTGPGTGPGTGIGTAPYTGPGTAPGTGPGTDLM